MSAVVRGDPTAHEVSHFHRGTSLSRGPDGAAILIIHTVMYSDTIDPTGRLRSVPGAIRGLPGATNSRVSGFGRAVATRPSGPRPRARAEGGQDPHDLRGRLRPHPGPGVRQVVLDGRVRQTEAVRGRLLPPGDDDRGDHPDLAVRGASGGAAGRSSRHALRTSSTGSGGSARRIVIGRSLVAGYPSRPDQIDLLSRGRCWPRRPHPIRGPSRERSA